MKKSTGFFFQIIVRRIELCKCIIQECIYLLMYLLLLLLLLLLSFEERNKKSEQ